LLRQLQQAGYLLPASFTGYLWLKGLHPALPGLSCPLRALTGVPCPTCFLSRATASALTGNLTGSLQLHAFGPVAAAALIWWSVTAIRQRRMSPPKPAIWPLGLTGLMLLGYWLLRLWLSFSQNIWGFPGFPILN